MDQTNLILAALEAGAVGAAQDTASEAVRDGYQGLKALIQRKFAGKAAAETALEQHAAKPATWKAPLQDALVESGAAQDGQILQAAQQLLQLTGPQQAAVGKYNLQVSGNVEGVVQGDHTRVTMTFGKPPRER